MIEARFVPIEFWPGEPTPSRNRRKSPFRGSWQNTLDGLEREIGHLKGRDILFQAYMRPEHIRNDGWPRSGAPNPSGPGIVVSFTANGVALSFPCDTFTDWRDNLRAVALGLSALRTVERYGITRRQEQYKGWAKLAAPEPENARKQAFVFFAKLTGWSESEIRADLQGAYRLACRAAHPDHNGNHEAFVALQSHWAALQ